MDQSILDQIVGLFGQLSPTAQGITLVITGLIVFTTQIAPLLPVKYRDKIMSVLGPIGPIVAPVFKALSGNYGAAKNAK